MAATTRYGWATRLRAVFGVTLEEVEEAHLDALVTERVRESEDLDFKRKPYANTDSGRRELAADIAAMANDRGGILIIGIREEAEIAVERTPTPIVATEEQRIRSIGTDTIRPYAAFYIRVIESKLTPGSVYYLVIVPPSTDRPHAVRKDIDLRYPRRNGGQTRWLSEAEVADAYRDRFARVVEDASKAERIVNDGVARIEREGNQVVLGLAVVPSTGAHMVIDSAAVAAVRDWLKQAGFMRNGVFGGPWVGVPASFGVGVRRVLLGTDGGRGFSSKYAYAELHADGCAFVGHQLFYADPQMQPSPATPSPCVSAEALSRALVVNLRFAARLSVERAGGFGDALVIAMLLVQGPLHLIGRGDYGLPQELGSVNADALYSRHSLPLDSLQTFSSDLLVAARLVANDLFQAFGVAETPAISPEGAIRAQAFRATSDVTEWAASHGIAVE